MFRIKVWAPTLASWMAISFTICVLGSLIVQGLPINHEGLRLFLPGFTWISWGSYVLGLVETAVRRGCGSSVRSAPQLFRAVRST